VYYLKRWYNFLLSLKVKIYVVNYRKLVNIITPRGRQPGRGSGMFNEWKQPYFQVYNLSEYMSKLKNARRQVRYHVDQMAYVWGYNFLVFKPSALLCHYRRLVTQYNRLSRVYKYAVLSANMAHSSVILPADEKILPEREISHFIKVISWRPLLFLQNTLHSTTIEYNTIHLRDEKGIGAK